MGRKFIEVKRTKTQHTPSLTMNYKDGTLRQSAVKGTDPFDTHNGKGEIRIELFEGPIRVYRGSKHIGNADTWAAGMRKINPDLKQAKRKK
jgi:hypothetical protein